MTRVLEAPAAERAEAALQNFANILDAFGIAGTPGFVRAYDVVRRWLQRVRGSTTAEGRRLSFEWQVAEGPTITEARSLSFDWQSVVVSQIEFLEMGYTGLVATLKELPSDLAADARTQRAVDTMLRYDRYASKFLGEAEVVVRVDMTAPPEIIATQRAVVEGRRVVARACQALEGFNRALSLFGVGPASQFGLIVEDVTGWCDGTVDAGSADVLPLIILLEEGAAALRMFNAEGMLLTVSSFARQIWARHIMELVLFCDVATPPADAQTLGLRRSVASNLDDTREHGLMLADFQKLVVDFQDLLASGLRGSTPLPAAFREALALAVYVLEEQSAFVVVRDGEVGQVFALIERAYVSLRLLMAGGALDSLFVEARAM